MRVTKPFGKVRITAKSGEEILSSVVRLKAAPGEMERVNIKGEKLKNLNNDITVSLEEI